ncbi:flippase [Haloplanus halobius]|uniref:flippase n=1 Tax=Haloplanus halobius TaxID=2934938 RepID=UPI00200F569F|nr:flippase [Haloplanus sp. XH21]
MGTQKSIFKLFLSNGGKSILVFLGTAIFARELGPNNLGKYFLYMAFIGIVSVISDLGVRGALEKRISESSNGEGYLILGILLKILIILPVIITLYGFKSEIEGYLDANIFYLVIIGVFLLEFAHLPEAILRGQGRVGDTATPQFFRYAIWVVVGYILINMGFNYRGLVYSALLGLFAMGIWNGYRIEINPSLPNMGQIYSIIDYSKFNFISDLNWYLHNWTDVLIIGVFLTSLEVGGYEVAWRASMILTLLSGAVGTAIFPRVSYLDSKNQYEKITQLLKDSHVQSLLLTVPGFAGVFLLSEDILKFLFGEEYTFASLVLVILCCQKVLYSFYIVYSRALHGLDRPDLAARAKITSVISNIILNIIFVYYIGIIGAAFATLISFTINTLLVHKYLTSIINIEYPIVDILWIALATSGMGVCVYVSTIVLPIKGILSLVVVVFIGSATYMLIILLRESTREVVLRFIAEL